MPTPLGQDRAVGRRPLPEPAAIAYEHPARAGSATVGMAPDLDLRIDRHSAETHSLGAAVASCHRGGSHAMAGGRGAPPNLVRGRARVGKSPVADAFGPSLRDPRPLA